MLRGAFSKNYKPGKCELCFLHVPHVERHHIKYSPEITIDLCHQCHFLAHFFPNRLKDEQKLKLLTLAKGRELAVELLDIYRRHPVVLAKLFAPSRREAIHAAQKEELERETKENKCR